MADECDPGLTAADLAAPACPTPVAVDEINIEELDVTASGLTSVTRCDAATGVRVDVIVCKDENHAGGQGQDTDDGVFVIEVAGYVDAAGAFVAGPYPGVLGDCPTREVGEPVCVLVDGVPSMARPVHVVDSDGSVTTVWVDPVTGVPVVGAVTLQSSTRAVAL